jgi:hypothetical protein
MGVFSKSVTLRICSVKTGLQPQPLAYDRHQHVNRHRDPDLGLHRILAGPVEGRINQHIAWGEGRGLQILNSLSERIII